jgi:endonuclease/exonuclease/phosphatase (EEP) superfamily protein YafD
MLRQQIPFSASNPFMKKSLLKSIRLISVLCLLIVLTFSIISYFGTLHRRFEITSHFKVQYLAASFACLLFLISLKAWRWTGVAVLCLLLNAIAILPWVVISPKPERPTHNLRLLLTNVNAANTNYQALLHLVDTEKPDLLIVQEASEGWINALESIRTTHPHSHFVANRDNAGIALFSRFPVEQFDTISIDDIDFPSLVVRINIAEVKIALISLHPPPPGTDEYLWERNQQFVKVAELVKRLPRPVIVAGDLNSSIWSPYYSEFVKQSGLVSARKGFGILPTWPTHNRFIMIPIDHCLVTDDIKISNCRTGTEVSSDHLPLITDMTF